MITLLVLALLVIGILVYFVIDNCKTKVQYVDTLKEKKVQQLRNK